MKLKDFRAKLKVVVDGIVDRDILREIGNEAREMVKSRTRKGFGVERELGPQTRLAGISESYKKQRKRLQKQGKLSPETTPGKSNMTKTGELLDTLNLRVNKKSVTVSAKGKKNQDKAKYNAKAGRTIFNLSKSENQKIKKLINQKINDDIKKQGL